MSKVEAIERGSLWRHYKGGIYFVAGVATHSETQETLVIYHRPEMPDHYELPPMPRWARPLKMWHEIVLTPKGPCPRFALARGSAPVEPGIGEIEELRAENERLRSVIASLMPGDAGRVE